MSLSLSRSFSLSLSFLSRSLSLLFRTAGLLVDLEVLLLGRVRLSLLEDELSDDELLERELLPELELLDDLEPLEELDSDELRLLSLLLEPDSAFFFLSLPRSFFLSLSSSEEVFFAIYNIYVVTAFDNYCW